MDNKKVSIDLTKDQYVTLLKGMYVATWVSESFNEEPEPAWKELVDLESYIFAKTHDAGTENLVCKDEETGDLFPSSELAEDDSINEALDVYDVSTIFTELAASLAHRDVSDDHSQEELDAMDDDKIESLIVEQENKYLKEFSEYGVERLYIKE